MTLPLLNDDESEMLITVFHHIRKKKHPHYTQEQARQDLGDSLHCLKLMGYTVIPRGILSSLKCALNKVND